MRSVMKLQKTLLCSAVSCALMPSFVMSEELPTDIETIEVVSDFRNQNLQQTAASLSVINEKEIALRNAQNLEEILIATPNVNFSSGSSRARYYQIRGVGERSQFKEPINPSVGLIIDDVDFTGIGSVSSMFDVEQVEVFRGPQGTKFGANALAGVVNINTKKPTDEFEGAIKLMAANYNSTAIGAAFSGPASEQLSYRLAIEQYTSDGFVDNKFLNKDNTNDKDELTIRTKFSYKATSDLTLDFSIFHFDFENGYDTFSLDNNRNTLSDEPGIDTQETTAASIKAFFKGFTSTDLVTIFSYADSDMVYGYDEDWSNPTLCQTNECIYGDYSSTDYYFRDRNSYSVEVRLMSKFDHQIFNDSTSWVVGFYQRQEENDLLREYTYAASEFTSTYETDSSAVFVQFDSQLNDQLTLTTGLRIEQRDLDYYDSAQLQFKPDDTMVGGKLVLAYQANQQTMFYSSVNRGFKAGGVNTDGSLSADKREFDPEYLWNYELGVKTSMLEDAAFVRLALFYMDRDDMQVKTYEDYERPDGTPGFLIYLDNAASGVNQGLEIDGAWNITDTFELYGALGLLDSEYKEFINGNGEDYSGKEQAHAPNYQFNIGINYHLTDRWLFNLNVDCKDEFYFSDSHRDKSDSVELVNASVTYSRHNWQIKAWGRNLTDQDYQTRGFFFGNDPRVGYEAKGYYQLGAPAEYGVTFNYQF